MRLDLYIFNVKIINIIKQHDEASETSENSQCQSNIHTTNTSHSSIIHTSLWLTLPLTSFIASLLLAACMQVPHQHSLLCKATIYTEKREEKTAEAQPKLRIHKMTMHMRPNTHQSIKFPNFSFRLRTVMILVLIELLLKWYQMKSLLNISNLTGGDG